MIVECEKTATGSNLDRCTLFSEIEIRDSVWYWWEEQTSKHVCQWIYPLIVRTALIDWPESSQNLNSQFINFVLGYSKCFSNRCSKIKERHQNHTLFSSFSSTIIFISHHFYVYLSSKWSKKLCLSFLDSYNMYFYCKQDLI